MTHACNLSNLETAAEAQVQVQGQPGQPGLYLKILKKERGTKNVAQCTATLSLVPRHSPVPTAAKSNNNNSLKKNDERACREKSNQMEQYAR